MKPIFTGADLTIVIVVFSFIGLFFGFTLGSLLSGHTTAVKRFLDSFNEK